MASTLLILAAAVLASAQAAKKDPKGSTIHFAALLPGNVNRFPFAFQKVLPALELAVANVTAVGGPLHGREIQVHHSNSECSTAIAMNHMFNFYIKKQVGYSCSVADIIKAIYCTLKIGVIFAESTGLLGYHSGRPQQF